MSCPDWPHCYGTYIPFPESKVPGGFVVAGQHYQWWQVSLEWGHRSLAAIIGLLMLALIVLGLKRPKHEEWPLSVATALILTQISLGALTIFKSNIHWSVMIHLGTAMLFFASLAWLRRAAASQGKAKPFAVPKIAKGLVIAFTVSVLVTMLVGTMVSTSFSGGVCGGLFSCDGQWFPTSDMQQHTHMMHRIWAVITVALSIALVVVAKRKAPQLRRSVLHSHGMVWGQVVLGVVTLYSFSLYPQFYAPLSIAHLAWGTLVWLVAIGTLLTLHYGNAGRFHKVR
jgi:heme a synthase